jgi:N-acyl-phosphatidylethanolamine-hydrolysing phospholipase D
LPRRRRHRADGTFRNNHVKFAPKGLGSAAALAARRLARRTAEAGAQPDAARRARSLGYLAANARAGMESSITWIGHASVLAQFDALNVLTDPMLRERASPLGFAGPKRVAPLGVALAELPHVGLAPISHDHYDHLDAPSVVALAARARRAAAVPGAARQQGVVRRSWHRQRRRARLVAVAPGRPETGFVLTPVQHGSGRTRGKRRHAPWGGWTAFAPDLQLFFSGDRHRPPARIRRDPRALRRAAAQRRQLRFAAIATGGYAPRGFMADAHVDPDEAARIHLDPAAKRSLGIHSGTFARTDESLAAAPATASAGASRARRGRRRLPRPRRRPAAPAPAQTIVTESTPYRQAEQLEGSACGMMRV